MLDGTVSTQNSQERDSLAAESHVDFYHLNELLTEEERVIQRKVRAFVAHKVIPVVGKYWDQAQFPFELVTGLAELGIAGCDIKGYGCPGFSPLLTGLIASELAYGDGSFHTFWGVHSGLAMNTIATFGSEEQKERWLPSMASLEKTGAFALTEPQHGSDSILLDTQARRSGDEWILNGHKKWIGNASFADVTIVWARDEEKRVRAFLVEKDLPGFQTTLINGKTSQRSAWQADIKLSDVRVPESSRLPRVHTFNDTAKILNTARSGVAWAALGHAMACYHYALQYTKKRVQFGKPLASYQLVQQKLVRMLAEITSMQLLCFRMGQLANADTMTSSMASLAKMQTALKARQIAADARDLLGGNGILLENHVARHQADLEGLFSYEGTDHIQTLIVGREITGIQAFF